MKLILTRYRTGLALVATLLVSAGAVSAAEVAWTSKDHYRVLLKVDPRGLDRSNSPAAVDLDFPRMLVDLGQSGAFDPHSIEVVALEASGSPRVYDDTRPERDRLLLPHRLDRYYGISRATLNFVVPDQTCTRYAVYFDTIESGHGQPRRYPGLVGDGDWFSREYGRREIGASKMDAFCDLDGDGDLDLFKVTTEPFIYCWENVGGNRYEDRGRMTSGGEVFVLPHDGSFRSWAVLRFDDWDGDGDQDLFVGFTVGTYTEQQVAYENVTKPGGPITFADRGPLKSESGKPIGGKWFVTIAVVDWDNDGRKDLLASELAPIERRGLKEFHRVNFHRNLSTDGDPWAFRFADGVPLTADGEEIIEHSPDIACADIDSDGDLDLFLAPQNGQVCWYRNVGTRSRPVFKPEGVIAAGGGHAGIHIADFTGDGLLDFVVSRLWEPAPEPGAPRYYAWLYGNVGTRADPKFEPADADHGSPYTEGFQSCDAGRQNVVRAADWNNDGRMDLLASTEQGIIYLFRNVGNRRYPLFAKEEPIVRGTGHGSRSEICDWNNDGRKDLLVANVLGELRLFLNEGTDAAPVLGEGVRVEANGKPIDGTLWCNAMVCDWDQDGRKDVIFGMGGSGNPSEHYDWPHRHDNPSQDEGFLFYRNVGTDAEPKLAFPKWIEAGGEVITGIRPNVGAYVDWDGDGRRDLIACEFENVIRLYRNLGSDGPNAEPRLAAGVELLRPKTVQMISGVNVLDFNGDGDLDILTGQGHGGSGLRFFERDYLDDTLNDTRPVVTVESPAQRKGDGSP